MEKESLENFEIKLNEIINKITKEIEEENKK